MRLCFVALSLLASCGRYRDFALPEPSGAKQEVKFRWEPEADPVIPRGPQADVLNPAIVRWQGALLNLYSNYDGKTWHTSAATSQDGKNWRLIGQSISPDPATWEGGYIAANGAALVVGNEIYYWYQSGRGTPRIGLARSKDGRTWTKHPRAVIPPGPYGSWDERGVADPYVIRSGNNFYLFYLGQDRARRQRLGVAISRDGVNWWKLRANPVLELGEAGAFDENGLGEPAVWQSHGSYWMLYAGRDRKEYRRIGLASSRDGVQWTRVSKQPLISGSHAWDSKVVCDPEVEVDGDNIRVWFGGGDAARPDENLNGQIGTGVLHIER
jgi:predicted GH43/DUF377 family glycosyl hydrolase